MKHPAWMPFALPVAIALPIVTGFLLAGPLLGFFVAALVALAVVLLAVPELRVRLSRQAARRFLAPLVVAIAGIVLIAAAGGTTRIIGAGVLALALTVAISLVFLEVGYSEDRARARDERRMSSRPRG